MKIGIVVGSIRDVRKADTVAAWAHRHATAHGGAQYELVDLKSFDVPLLTEATLPMMADRQYRSEQVTAWSRAIDACDGFVFVTPEYNHGVPGAFKNAVDSLGPEWVGKAVGFISYGADGGVRCVEHWRSSLANFQMVDVRQQVALFLHTDFSDAGFTPMERRAGELSTLLDQLVAMTGRLRD
jgi:NAD(P)H-dependent FMN reductase